MKTTIFETPVVLIVYNRPEETYLVLKKILDVNPNKLLIIADGPKNQKDKLLTDEVRKIIRESCDESNMITNYADENMGTKKRIVSGLNWVFDQVNKAIILEDDCLPDTSFFKYAETLLEYYKDDYRIMTISGNNFYEKKKNFKKYSYYYSYNHHIWGWATWKRAWNLYDSEMKSWNDFKEQDLLLNLFGNQREARIWFDILNSSYINPQFTWDHQWVYTCLRNSAYCIIPQVNLVKNIGFSIDATRTKEINHPLSDLKTSQITFPLNHPKHMIREKKLDMIELDLFKTSIIQKVFNKLL